MWQGEGKLLKKGVERKGTKEEGFTGGGARSYRSASCVGGGRQQVCKGEEEYGWLR